VIMSVSRGQRYELNAWVKRALGSSRQEWKIAAAYRPMGIWIETKKSQGGKGGEKKKKLGGGAEL